MANIEEAFLALSGGTQQAQQPASNIEEAFNSLGAVDSQANNVNSSQPTAVVQQNQDLSLNQNLMLGFTANDDRAIEYIQEQFPNSQLAQDEQGNILVDDKRINPRGFDVGDIGRNAGYAFNLAAQILGSIGGGAAGSFAGPGGVAAGMVAGGTAGGITGEALRLATGKVLGLDANEKEVFDRLAEEAIVAGVGEVAGLATFGAGKLLGKSGVGKEIANLWQKTINRAKKSELPLEDIIRFTSQIDEDFTYIATKENKPSEVINPEFMRQDKIVDIAKKTLFGKNAAKESPRSLNRTTSSGATKGQILLAESIKDVNNQGYDSLMMDFGGLNDDMINTIKVNSIKDVLNPQTTSDGAYTNLARDIVDNVGARRNEIGKEIEKQARKAKGTFNFDETALNSAKLIQRDFTTVIKQTGFDPKRLPDVPGYKQLNDLTETLFGFKMDKQLDAQGNLVFKKIKTPLGNLSKRNARAINNSIDNQVDAIFKNQKIPSNIKNAVREIRSDFKASFYQQFGTEEQAKRFAQFAKLTDDISLDGRGAIDNIANNLKSTSQTGLSKRGDIIAALNGMNTPEGTKLIQRLYKTNAAQGIKNINSFKMLSKFENVINDKKIASSLGRKGQTGEIDLLEINKNLLGGNQSSQGRVFIGDARKYLAAQAFTNNRTDMLRMNAMLSLLSFGSLGGLLGGPMGAVAGIGIARAANPKNVGKLLVAAEKASGGISKATKSLSKKISNFSSRAKDLNKPINDKQAQALLRSILSRNISSSNTESSNKNNK